MTQVQTLHLRIVTTKPDTFVAQSLVDASQCTELGQLSTEDPPTILLPDGSRPGRVDATDVLEHVVDEEAWLAAIRAALPAGGSLIVRVPFEGPVAWLDARNGYRYLQDVTGWGKRLLETQTKGWHRHYTRFDLETLLRDAGFTVDRVERHGSPQHDVVQLGQLVWGKILRGDEFAEFAAIERRIDADAGLDLPWLGPFSTKIAAWATAR